MQDHDAIRRLRRGDIAALTALITRYETAALRVAVLITGDAALAQDITQAAFVRVYENASQFDPSRPFSPWFMRIVTNAAIKAAQRQARTYSLDASLNGDEPYLDRLIDPMPGPEARASAAEERAQVRAALDQLTPDQRAVIVLRYYADLSEAEMAIVLACPPGTVKSRLHTARTRLRGLLAPLQPQFQGDD